MASVCVIGGGPAGSIFAARMAQLGYDVTLVERSRFPRRHIGESLSPGVLPLLESFGTRSAVEAAGFTHVRRVHVCWGTSDTQVREDSREEGLLVDRGVFDAILLGFARRCGVRVLQPAQVLQREWIESGWEISVSSSEGVRQLRADFLADAGGRGAASHPERVGCRTLALYAYWQGEDLPTQPRIEAGADAWYWGMPLPGGLYNAQVFVDARAFSVQGFSSLESCYYSLLGRSGILADSRTARLADTVRATDATAYLHATCATTASIRLGEAAIAIDPISSSGVQKAVQSALAGAIVANTLVQRPELAEIAIRFFHDDLKSNSERHARWAAGYYAQAAARFETPFWLERAAGTDPQMSEEMPKLDPRALAETKLALSPQLAFADVPCLDGQFVTVRRGLLHPRLEAATVYVGGFEAAALLKDFYPGCTFLELVRSWRQRMPVESGLAIAGWLVNHGLLVSEMPDGRGDA